MEVAQLQVEHRLRTTDVSDSTYPVVNHCSRPYTSQPAIRRPQCCIMLLTPPWRVHYSGK
jgi:hypothetical protein